MKVKSLVSALPSVTVGLSTVSIYFCIIELPAIVPSPVIEL